MVSTKEVNMMRQKTQKVKKQKKKKSVNRKKFVMTTKTWNRLTVEEQL